MRSCQALVNRWELSLSTSVNYKFTAYDIGCNGLKGWLGSQEVTGSTYVSRTPPFLPLPAAELLRKTLPG